MASVANIIRGAFKIMGVLAAEETPTASQEADALDVLNDMLDSWSGERLALFATRRDEYALTPGLNPHTMGLGGSGGDIDAARPLGVERASLIASGITGFETPLGMLSDGDWQATPGKAAPGIPMRLWVETSYPLLKLWLQPVPNLAHTLVLYTGQELGRFSSAALTFDMPQGYARAIRYNLAKELAPEYGLSLSAEATDIANESKETLKRVNYRPSYMSMDQ
jgi:hypothetical protein